MTYRRTILAAGAMLVAAACLPERIRRPGELRGVLLPEAAPKPEFVMMDTDGADFDFRSNTSGYLTLLFLGYTHCPDVCPVHMANIAAVLETLRPTLTSRIKVVMVTVDPKRDSATRLREWLDQFDTDFIGLRPDSATIAALQRELNVAPATFSAEGDDYLVGHASQVFVFAQDDSLRVLYPFGTRQADWAHDIPLLLDGRWSNDSE